MTARRRAGREDMMKPNLTPRAIVALSTAGASLFLLLCFTTYGTREAMSAMPPKGWSDVLAAWCIGPLGVGAHVIAILGLVWGVIVYFQERTPDLVLRMVGTTTLAASVAMLMGLVQGGEHSVWAGTVGTAGAHMLTSIGTFGTVLGWLVVPALVFFSAVFATDRLFHTLRASGRTAFDPRNLPTEPSRGDLLEEPADAEAREFVPSTSRAAEFVEAIDVQEPKPLEVLPEALPKGFSASPLSGIGGRTLVRGPSGYAGVEFLATGDDLALPPAAADVVRERDDRAVDTSFGVGVELYDAPLDLHDDDLGPPDADDAAEAPTQETAPAAAPASETPAAETPASETTAAPASEAAAEPVGGIGLGDASLFVDEYFVVAAPFDAATTPHDGASAVAEIASNWSATDAADAADAPARDADDAATATEDRADDDAHESHAPEESAGPRFDDDVVVVGSAFDDDILYVVDETPGFAAAPEAPSSAAPSAPSAYASGSVSVMEAPAAVAVEASPDAAEAASSASIDDIASESPAAAEAAPPLELEAADHDWAVDDSIFAPAAAIQDAPAEAPAAATEPSAEVADVAAPVRTEQSVAASAAWPVIDVATDAVPASPLVEPADVAVEALAVAAETPAVADAPAAPESPAASQLGLFPAPAFDAAKLAGMDLDPLFSEASKAILARGRASAVVLQRALGIGYARGLRILDQMTSVGMLGPDSPGGAREICFVEPPL